MTTALTQPTNASKRKFHSLKIDMTPMVDLGFLLITFFIFTATLSQPSVTRLIMPAKGTGMTVSDRNALTILLDKDKAYVYEGQWEEAIKNKAIQTTDYSLQHGISSFIRTKQKRLEKKDDLVVIIKPLVTSSYQNIITALDEVTINSVTKYAVTDATNEEVAFLARY